MYECQISGEKQPWMKSKEEMPTTSVPLPTSPTHKKARVDEKGDLPWVGGWVAHLLPAEKDINKLISNNNLKDARIEHYTHVEPILQDGPQCGLVALAIISQTYSQPVSVSQLLAEARVRGFTQYGEVYSVDFMSTLAAEYLPEHRPEIIVDDQNSIDTISQALINGTVILAPYDADFNHAPCLKRGHKAHWALLVGIISSRQGYYVLARHGKSRHIACWPLRDLIESNGNLEEEGAARYAGGYVIPKGGVGGQRGLRGRMLALHPY